MFSSVTNYQRIFSEALSFINNIEESEFEYADYILVDERQDFPEVFLNCVKK